MLCRASLRVEPACLGFQPLPAIQQLGDLVPVMGLNSFIQQIAVCWMSAPAE